MSREDVGDPNELRAYYAKGMERDRLDGPKGQLEYRRSQDIILRALPSSSGVVADIGGGPGRYTIWLAELGYHVEHRDLMAIHVDQLQQALQGRSTLSVSTAVGDARRLDLADQSVDVVLLMGPLYHLVERHDRVQALKEAKRILKPGGSLSRPPSRDGHRGWMPASANELIARHPGS